MAMYLPSDNPTSLVGWFRKGVGVTVTGAGVSTWADQSGAGNDLLQGTDTNRPAYDGSAIITCDGGDNFLKCAAFTLNQPTQVSALMNQVTWVQNRRLFDGNTTNTGALLQKPTGEGGVSPQIEQHAGSVGAFDGNLTVNTFLAVTSLFAGASSSIKVGASAETATSPGTNNMGGFTWGCAGGAILFGNVAAKEIILRNVDDATIRAADHQYLIDLQNDVIPVAAFTADVTSGTPPLTVNFTDQSTNSPREWLWDFGDGQTATTQNPTNIYAADGTYTVTLTATNYAGADSEIKTDYITVTTPAVTPAGGHFSPPDDSKRRKEERRREESRREAIGRLFQNAQDLPPAEREEVVAIEKRFTPPEVIGVDFRALFEQAELVKRLIALERAREDAVTQRRRDDEDDEDAIMAALQ